jgi:hypothetical protein
MLTTGDDGAAAIASFVRESRSFVFEIHLSHNRLTIKGKFPFRHVFRGIA